MGGEEEDVVVVREMPEGGIAFPIPPFSSKFRDALLGEDGANLLWILHSSRCPFEHYFDPIDVGGSSKDKIHAQHPPALVVVPLPPVDPIRVVTMKRLVADLVECEVARFLM